MEGNRELGGSRRVNGWLEDNLVLQSDMLDLLIFLDDANAMASVSWLKGSYGAPILVRMGHHIRWTHIPFI